jgi:RTX calcium-binding nonapeptide repeat (4 copies)
MLRRTRTELIETIERSRAIYSPLGWKYNETEKMWRAPNGARLPLFGFGGKDALDGGPGNDDLFGGPGNDQLTGGSGFDTFHYAKLSDSGITAGTRDLIADFEPGIDQIDLQLIDANKTNAAGTNDAFNFIGNNAPFTGGHPIRRHRSSGCY